MSEVKSKTIKGVAVSLQVDTTQLDEAITKTNKLLQLLERAEALTYRIGIDLGKGEDRTIFQKVPPHPQG